MLTLRNIIILFTRFSKATSNCLEPSRNYSFLFRAFRFVIPMGIPVWEYFCIPNFFNFLFVNSKFELVLQLLDFLISSLNQNTTNINNPISSLFICFCFQIQSSMSRNYWKTKRIELLWNFIFFHYLGSQTYCDPSDIFNKNVSGLFILTFFRITHPLNSFLIRRKVDFPLHKLIGTSTNFKENITFH